MLVVSAVSSDLVGPCVCQARTARRFSTSRAALPPHRDFLVHLREHPLRTPTAKPGWGGPSVAVRVAGAPHPPLGVGAWGGGQFLTSRTAPLSGFAGRASSREGHALRRRGLCLSLNDLGRRVGTRFTSRLGSLPEEGQTAAWPWNTRALGAFPSPPGGGGP